MKKPPARSSVSPRLRVPASPRPSPSAVPPASSLQPPASKDALELITLSRRAGADPNLVQAGGGNTSVKSADGVTMYVKASGVALAAMAPGQGYRRVRLADALAMLTDARLGRLPAAEREREVLQRLVDSTVDDLAGRPSVETSLHAFLGRAVAHTHPALGNGLCCARNGPALAREWFADPFGEPLFVPYVDPGLPLARATYRAVRRYQAENGRLPTVIFLANHGVFVSADKAAGALAVSRRIEATVHRHWTALRLKETGPHALPRKGPPDAARDRIADAMRQVWSAPLGVASPIVKHTAGHEVARALAHPRIEALMRVGPLTPDHVVYAHGQPVWIVPPQAEGDLVPALTQALSRARRKLPQVPRALLVSGIGLFVAGDDEKLVDSALAITRASLLTLLCADALGGCRALTPRAVQYIENWEVESFRRKVAKS